MRTLEQLGASVVETRRFGDHHVFSEKALPADVPPVITEKDAVRGTFIRDDVLVLEIALRDWPDDGG